MNQGKIYLAQPRGFCAGVIRALETVEKALREHGAPVYVLHEIVHNDFVVDSLRQKGVIFVEELEAVPEGAVLIFSAHGVSRGKEKKADQMGLKVIDATCLLVKKIHEKAACLEKEGFSIILIGHRNHPEINGTLGQLDNPAFVVESADDIDALNLPEATKAAYLTQTTLSVDDTREIVEKLKERFPGIEGGGDICYATRDRQKAVKLLCEKCDLIFIIGSAKSSNSNRLRELAEKCGVKAFLINSADDVDEEILPEASAIGISAGASAPESLVAELVEFLKTKGFNTE